LPLYCQIETAFPDSQDRTRMRIDYRMANDAATMSSTISAQFSR
jgi:hypothetical protein